MAEFDGDLDSWEEISEWLENNYFQKGMISEEETTADGEVTMKYVSHAKNMYLF
eukprot:CAMPEP_0170491974 /NCGR_PEP_ID=MMETSP0208-20121228/11460_1 /TAXON_ID=197538 /ORGANISM="Strombidium inclinatum, Strain S3" /LENGTH=53 /DNA_ID=CAMNT_0010767639 /DNA_START=332 /DNA_END=493 /DNA_ORIENTATION=-